MEWPNPQPPISNPQFVAARLDPPALAGLLLPADPSTW